MEYLPRGSQSKIAAQLGVSRQWVSKVLQGRANDEKVRALAYEIATAPERAREAAAMAEFDARHCACTDDDDPNIASELVFTLMGGQLYVAAFGKGEWPNVGNSSYVLTPNATAKLLAYLKSAA